MFTSLSEASASGRARSIRRRPVCRGIALLAILAATPCAYAFETCPGFDAGQAAQQKDRPKPAEKGIFDELDPGELAAVRDFLEADATLQLSNIDEAEPISNYLYMAEMLPPPKAAAMAYLDGKGPKPERRAYAVLVLLNSSQPRVQQVVVGPLPSPTYWKEHKPASQTPIHFHSRGGSTPEYTRLEEIVQDAMVPLLDMTKQVLGGYTYGEVAPLNYTCEEKCLSWTDAAPRGGTTKQRKYWIWFIRAEAGQYIQPSGLAFYMDMSGLDASKWKVDKVYFGNRIWNTPEHLANYWKKNPGQDMTANLRGMGEGTTAWRFNNVTYVTPGPADADLASMKILNTGPTARPASKRRGPIQVEPDGKRYTINGSHIEYEMGWSLNVGIRSTGAMRFWDFRFKGQRVVWEMALQAATATYGGMSIVQASTAYQDQAWGMGAAHHEILHGVDCPLHSSYFDFHHLWNSHDPYTLPRSMCVFEHSFAEPLRRHYDKDFLGGYNFMASAPSHGLVIRSFATVYNYDYQYDLVLYADGTIQFKQGSLGYPQAERHFWGKPEDGYLYGYKFWADAGGSVHDHMINMKIDIDVLGTNNTLVYEEPTAIKAKFAAFDPHLPPNLYTRTTTRVEIKSEAEAAFKLQPTVPRMWFVKNNDFKNRWGSTKGYSIKIKDYIHQLMPDDWAYIDASGYNKHQLVATRQHDDEYVSSTLFDEASPATPVLNFTKYRDNDEPLIDQDLVLWVTIGHHHIPVAEDGPTSGSAGTYSTFVMKPHNMFDGDPVRDLLETVVITPDPETGEPVIEGHGMQDPGSVDCDPDYPKIPFNGFYGADAGGEGAKRRRLLQRVREQQARRRMGAL